MKQKNRTVFDNDDLQALSKDELRELLDDEKNKVISNYLGGEILKIPKSATKNKMIEICLLYASPSPRDQRGSRMPSSA